MLALSLTIVFAAFCAIMAGVLMFCIKERRMVDGLNETKQAPMTTSAIEAEDNRIVIVLFGSIIAGAALALITGYLVFFRTWA
jgi:hypothetical protein